MLIRDLANSGAMPVLAETMRFSGQRARLIAHNVANLDTPDFRPLDVSVTDFQASLRKAVEKRRIEGPGRGLAPAATGEVERTKAGAMVFKPKTSRGNVLYHDRNNRDLERLMQDLSENAMMYRMASDFMRRETDLIRSAISQRV